MLSPRGDVPSVRLSVLHVITRLTLGGSAENTIASAVALARAAYAPAVATGVAESDAAVLEDARARGCRILDAPGLGREASARRDLIALGRLVRFMRRERPAIVHTHTSKAGFLGRLAARLTGVPAIIHQPHGHVFYGYWGRRRTALYIGLERLAARWCDRIVTLTDRGAEEHLARGIGRRDQYRTVPSGVPTAEIRSHALSRLEARRELGLPRDAFVVAGLGRLVPIKGFDVLVGVLRDVQRAVPRARVVLIGDGPERSRLEAMAAALGVAGGLLMPGARTDAVRLLSAADVLAAPSRNEGMGRALVEAMALGVPVVATAVGGIPEVIGGGECGRLVPVDDEVALAAALIELARDRALARKLGDAAMHRAERFSTTAADARMLALYEELVRAKALA
ncbi:MAG: glycosyltransferase [Candidatus Rokubacteria bacterium]|nr:glycosyltransferase [Candidatus Rokubacteria bacterium]